MTDVMFLPSSGDRPDAPDISVVVTDGVSNVNQELVPDASIKAHRNVSKTFTFWSFEFATKDLW